MADETAKGGEPGASATGATGTSTEGAGSRGAAQDLADGLELMMRAARKAVKNVDAARIEDLGRRALRGLDTLDRTKVEQFGRKAARHLDPKKVEEVAEEAGRELLAVVERVAERVETLIGSTGRGPTAPADKPADKPGTTETSPAAERPRVRVESDDKGQ